jgi:hypothetical protein
VASLPAMEGRHFILTSTNKSQVEKLASTVQLAIFEIVGLPYDLNELIQEVRQALRARPVR